MILYTYILDTNAAVQMVTKEKSQLLKKKAKKAFETEKTEDKNSTNRTAFLRQNNDTKKQKNKLFYIELKTIKYHLMMYTLNWNSL